MREIVTTDIVSKYGWRHIIQGYWLMDYEITNERFAFQGHGTNFNRYFVQHGWGFKYNKHDILIHIWYARNGRLPHLGYNLLCHPQSGKMLRESFYLL